MWEKGSPIFTFDPLGAPTCWLLEFEEGDRFVVARYIVEEEEAFLEDINLGCRITDKIKQHLKIPDPDGVKI